jgi:hypothetical protein
MRRHLRDGGQIEDLEISYANWNIPLIPLMMTYATRSPRAGAEPAHRYGNLSTEVKDAKANVLYLHHVVACVQLTPHEPACRHNLRILLHDGFRYLIEQLTGLRKSFRDDKLRHINSILK